MRLKSLTLLTSRDSVLLDFIGLCHSNSINLIRQIQILLGKEGVEWVIKVTSLRKRGKEKSLKK